MKTAQKGFTLVELLVVIAIIAILAAVVVLIVNPVEITKQSRDAARLSDLANLQQAMNVATQESDFYVCGVAGTPPVPVEGYCGGLSTAANAANANGTGWVDAVLNDVENVSVPNLPLDPSNDTTYYYSYCANAGTAAATEYDWEINAVLESDKYVDKMENDGGDAAAKYEVGSKLTVFADETGTECE